MKGLSIECCPPQKIQTDLVKCSGCGNTGQSIKTRTIKHWLITELVPTIPEVPFYFCKTRGCPVVYFSGDGSIRYTKDQLRGIIGDKETTPPIPACYCFGVTEEMISGQIQKTGKSSYSTWIAKEVKEGNCACDVRNPEGNCCLAEIRKAEKGH